VEPPENVVTPAVAGIVEDQLGALPVVATRTCPVVPAPVTPIADAPLPYKTPFAANVDTPVPPFPTTSVPLSVTAPVVAVLGVKPVVPAVNDVTAAEEGIVDDQLGAAPVFPRRNCPVVPAAVVCNPLEPFPKITP